MAICIIDMVDLLNLIKMGKSKKKSFKIVMLENVNNLRSSDVKPTEASKSWIIYRSLDTASKFLKLSKILINYYEKCSFYDLKKLDHFHFEKMRLWKLLNIKFVNEWKTMLI